MRGLSGTCHRTRLSWLAPNPQTWTPRSSSPRRVQFGLSGFCCSGCTINCWQGLGLGGMEYAGKAWTWTPTWSALLDMGGFNPEAANRGAYAGVVHGIASRPKSKPKPAATPAGGPPQLHPPNPRDAFAKARGGISPALDCKARYVDCVLALI